MEIRIAMSEFLMSGMLLLAIAAPTSAHHSAAGYDMTKTLTAPATIKEFRWGAPHSSAVFMIKGANGKPEEVVMVSSTPARADLTVTETADEARQASPVRPPPPRIRHDRARSPRILLAS
jgi:hypothetical protein